MQKGSKSPLIWLAGMRSLAVVALGSLVMTIGMSVAVATSDTGSQNPDVTVTSSLSPDVVTVGGTLTGTATVTNNTNRTRKFRVKAVLSGPNGWTHSQSQSVRLGPGQSASQAESVLIDASVPPGQYSLRVSVKSKKTASVATATATVQ